MLNQRLNDKGKNWRHVMKSLTVLEFLLLNGSETVVLWAKDNIYVIKTLREFQYRDDSDIDQGQNVRARAKNLTALIQDDERLRHERHERRGRGGRGRRGSRPGNYDPAEFGDNDNRGPRNTRGARRPSGNPGEDDEISRALEQSRITAEEEEEARRRRLNIDDDDEDLRKALVLSREEDEQRRIDQENAFKAQKQNENLIDLSASTQQPQVALQYQFTAQPYVTGQYNAYGTPANGALYQQPVTTGYIQNMYSANDAQYPDYSALQQQQQQYQSNAFLQQFSEPQQPQQQPLAPMKTGSNNPFAKLTEQPSTSYASGQSLDSIQQQQQQQRLLEQQKQQQLLEQQQQQYYLQQQQQQAAAQQQQQQQQQLKAVHTGRSEHVEELNTLLATGTGLDTYGNTGDLRIPAQHTRSQFINSQGTGYQAGFNGGAASSNNPFMGTQYTGVPSTNPIQPAFTGYGFGNAQQSQQQYQQTQQYAGYGQQAMQQPQQQQQTRGNGQSLIDI